MGGQTPAPLFSPSGDSLALASADGIIRVYDTGTGRLKTALGQGDGIPGANGTDASANGHLVEKNTCLVWATSGRKKKKAVSWSSLLLVGTAAGDVKAFDPHMGELKWRAQGLVDGGVSSLAHSSKKPGVVLAAGASGQVITLSTETGEVVETFKASAHAITCLAVSADGGHAFGGGSSLALWDLSSQERVAKFTGHVVPASSCLFTPGSSAVASVCPGERHVAVWAMPPGTTHTLDSSQDQPSKVSKAKKGLRPTATTLPMSEAPVQLDACSRTPAHAHADGEAPQGNGSAAGQASTSGFCVCAVSDGGEAYVWECGTSSGDDQGLLEGAALQGSLLTMVRVGPQTGSTGLTDRILAAKLVPNGSGLSLLVARGSTARPVFETVSLPSSPASGSDQLSSNVVTLAPAAAGALLPGRTADATMSAGKAEAQPAKTLKRKGVDVTVVGPGGDLGAPMMRTTGVAAAAAGKAAAEEEEEDHGDGDDDVDMAPEALQPLGERVAALNLAAQGGAGAGPNAGGGTEADTAAAGPQASDKANSLAVLLTQALRSNDRSLLERCLSTTTSTVIINTVARLLPIDAAAFLRAAVDRLLSSPARAGQLAPWVKAVLHHHTGYIMSAPGAQAPLAALYQAIDARVSVYSQLLRLHGRLGLVTAHARAAATPGFGALEPEVVFQDQDEAVEGMQVEDPFALGDDDDDDELEGNEEGSEEGEEGSEDDWEEEDGGDLLGDDDDDE